jgi:hypothetical protein
MAAAVTAAHPSNVSGRPLNPDTGLLFPSASAAQEQLADELLARLVDGGVGAGLIAATRDRIRDALVEVAVRQDGRTIRAIRDELNDAATGYEADARTLAEDALASEEPFTPDRAASIAKLTTAARTLRTVLLGGWRS